MTSLRSSISFLTATRLVFNITNRMISVFLPAIARGLGVSLERAGLLVAARSLAGAATPAVVMTAGRNERHLRLISWSLVLFAAGAAMTAASGIYVGALAGFILLGLSKPAFDTAALAYVADRTPYDRRARFLSIMELTWAAGLLVGAPAVGWLMGRFGWHAPFWAASALAAIALASAPAFLETVVAPDDGARGPFSLNRSARALLTAMFVISLAAEASFVVFGAWLENVFALSLIGLGAASAVIGGAEMLGEGTVLVFADRAGKRRMVMAGLGLSAAGYGVLAANTESLGTALAILVVIFIAFEVTIVAAIPLATEVMPTARSRYLALLIVGISLGRAVGAAIGPPIFGAGGMPANVLVSGAGMLVALVLVWRFVTE